MKLEFEKTIVVSTAHISQKDNELLKIEAEHIGDLLVVYHYDYGFRIFTGTPIDELVTQEVINKYSSTFCALLRIAEKNNCDWLKLDCDGSLIEGLKRFYW